MTGKLHKAAVPDDREILRKQVVSMNTKILQSEVREHLETKLLPFWKNLKDDENGGYYGYMDFDLNVDKKAVKGCILNSRIMWFFASAAMTLKDSGLLVYAKHAFDFMKKYCVDDVYGGVYWSVTYDGHIEDDLKHTYNQAFAIYALSAYYDASGDDDAIVMAWRLYDLIESKCRDVEGYLEAFERDFQPTSNEKLSENGVMAEKTMNTLLHVFEAYTELYRVTKEEKVADNLHWMMDIFADKVYAPKRHRQEVFFDRHWHTLIDLHSYGHDIETAWLLDRGLQVLGDETLSRRMKPLIRDLTSEVYKKAYHRQSLWNECEKGTNDKTRVWWVQAEAVVGFLNGYENSPEHPEYLQAACDIWTYIKTYLVDKREGSEWFWCVDDNGVPASHKPVVEPWKCPYHNGRMCFEVIRRLG